MTNSPRCAIIVIETRKEVNTMARTIMNGLIFIPLAIELVMLVVLEVKRVIKKRGK